MNPDDIVIVAAKRTPLGAMLGALSSLSAPELGAVAHRAAILQAQISPNDIDEVFPIPDGLIRLKRICRSSHFLSPNSPTAPL